jgi:hypothetical protein
MIIKENHAFSPLPNFFTILIPKRRGIIRENQLPKYPSHKFTYCSRDECSIASKCPNVQCYQNAKSGGCKNELYIVRECWAVFAVCVWLLVLGSVEVGLAVVSCSVLFHLPILRPGLAIPMVYPAFPVLHPSCWKRHAMQWALRSKKEGKWRTAERKLS